MVMVPNALHFALRTPRSLLVAIQEAEGAGGDSSTVDNVAILLPLSCSHTCALAMLRGCPALDFELLLCTPKLENNMALNVVSP